MKSGQNVMPLCQEVWILAIFSILQPCSGRQCHLQQTYGIGRSQSFTYDSAIASLVYTLSGQTQKTERILDAYQKEFYKDNFTGSGSDLKL